MLNKLRLTEHFSQAAAEYDEYANVQKKMADYLISLSSPSKKITTILEIGCGTGLLTKKIAAAFPAAAILATDISPAMLAYAKKQLSNYDNIQFQVQDGEKISDSNKYDLIISNAVFQWFTNYETAFTAIYNSLKSNGQLFFSTFGPNTFKELHHSFHTACAQNLFSQQWKISPDFYSINDLAYYLKNAGFTNSFETLTYTEYFSTVREFLRSVKKVGANNSSKSSYIHTNRKIMLDMLQLYETNYKFHDKVPATYETIFVHSQK